MQQMCERVPEEAGKVASVNAICGCRDCCQVQQLQAELEEFRTSSRRFTCLMSAVLPLERQGLGLKPCHHLTLHRLATSVPQAARNALYTTPKHHQREIGWHPTPLHCLAAPSDSVLAIRRKSSLW